MDKDTRDFMVESNGQCFFCLRQTTPEFPSPSITRGLPAPVKTLQCLSRYLEMDMKKIFDNSNPIPPALLKKVLTSNLKAELCKECSILGIEFSEHFKQLEKIQMEITSCMDLIREKFLEADLKGEIDKFEDLTCDMIQSTVAGEDNENYSGSKVKLNIFHVLRTETRQKCDLKLRAIRPRIRIQNLTPKEICMERFKLHQSRLQRQARHDLRQSKVQILSDPDPGIQIGVVKIEQVQIPLHSILDDGYADADYDSGDDLEMDSISDISKDNEPKVHMPTSSSSTNSKNKNQPSLQSSQRRSYRRKCNFCDKQFASSNSVNSHMEAVHLPIPIHDVVNLLWDEFNSELAKHDLSEAQLEAIHDIRRKGRNKIAARNMRKRKLDEILQLEDEVAKIREKKNSLIMEREGLLTRRSELTERYNLLDKVIFKALQGQRRQH